MTPTVRRVSKKGILGFTFIELLVAATIIALLSAIGLVSFTSANRKARNGRRMADLEQVRAALELYRSDEGVYPPASGGWVEMSEITPYLSNPNIVDPKNVGNYTYTYDNTSPFDAASGCSSSRSYALCAREEPDETLKCVCSP